MDVGKQTLCRVVIVISCCYLLAVFLNSSPNVLLAKLKHLKIFFRLRNVCLLIPVWWFHCISSPLSLPFTPKPSFAIASKPAFSKVFKNIHITPWRTDVLNFNPSSLSQDNLHFKSRKASQTWKYSLWDFIFCLMTLRRTKVVLAHCRKAKQIKQKKENF